MPKRNISHRRPGGLKISAEDNGRFAVHPKRPAVVGRKDHAPAVTPGVGDLFRKSTLNRRHAPARGRLRHEARRRDDARSFRRRLKRFVTTIRVFLGRRNGRRCGRLSGRRYRSGRPRKCGRARLSKHARAPHVNLQRRAGGGHRRVCILSTQCCAVLLYYDLGRSGGLASTRRVRSLEKAMGFARATLL